ncbi:hydratase domain-containing protein 3, mitochondrial [Seminavis robusta]|uniref:Enoyl-CoA hydratase domain-containing protein 3, mitochondrial n=1 Tax=Seminavis robusta TaxID=568900 RepID=A0A9N8HP34_9STRA|nr:hydratase domain-containing protein 3, mitochondrial [Seminavis robusta]|eukprot:Sro1141_g245670.1 hydratase domain-containing protein 3, mitochondrial (332) ;mRNA; f:25198-26193
MLSATRCSAVLIPSVGRHHCLRQIRYPLSTSSATASTSNIPDGIATLALNNPKRRNALSSSVLSTMLEKLLKIKSDPATKVLIIKSLDDESQYNGVFCSGHDLQELSFQPDNESKEAYQHRLQDLFQLCSRVMTEINTFPVPTIAQVDGIATAAGCQLVASCDLAVATVSSQFATPGVRIGLFCSTPAVPLVRAVASRKHVMEMLLTGDLISAQRAYEIGLINRIIIVADDDDSHHHVEDDDNDKLQRQQQVSRMLHQEVQSLASTIAEKSSPCIRSGLQTLREQQGMLLTDAYPVAERTMVENLLNPDAKEGIDAFLNKRKPKWTGRKDR